jgi:hypothetical protein
MTNLSTLARESRIDRIAGFAVLALRDTEFVRLSATDCPLAIPFGLSHVVAGLHDAAHSFLGLVACRSMSVLHVLPPAMNVDEGGTVASS